MLLRRAGAHMCTLCSGEEAGGRPVMGADVSLTAEHLQRRVFQHSLLVHRSSVMGHQREGRPKGAGLGSQGDL